MNIDPRLIVDQNPLVLLLACCAVVALPALLLSIYAARAAVRRWASGRAGRVYRRESKKADREAARLETWLAKQDAAHPAARDRGQPWSVWSLGAISSMSMPRSPQGARSAGLDKLPPRSS
jgi:hypothetical protein